MQKTIKTKNVSLWTESFGKKNNPAVIFVSGAMAPATFWPTDFIKDLAKKRFFVIRFDNRDMGYSTHFPPVRPGRNIKLAYSIDDLLKDVLNILNAYKIKKAHVIGHSMGAGIAQLFAIKYPAHTLTATAISGDLLGKGDLPFKERDKKNYEKIWATFMANPMYPDYKRGAKEFLKVWECLHGSLKIDEKMANEYTKRIYKTETIEPAFNHVEVQQNIPDKLGELKRMKAPLLFIQGEEEPLAASAENIKILSNAIPNSTFKIIPKAGHIFFNKEIWNQIKTHLLTHFNR